MSQTWICLPDLTSVPSLRLTEIFVNHLKLRPNPSTFQGFFFYQFLWTFSFFMIVLTEDMIKSYYFSLTTMFLTYWLKCLSGFGFWTLAWFCTELKRKYYTANFLWLYHLLRSGGFGQEFGIFLCGWFFLLLLLFCIYLKFSWSSFWSCSY